MQKLIAIAGVYSSLVGGWWGPTRQLRSDPVLVRAVLDGDTIDVATIGRVRLLGIDAPEVAHRYESAAPFGREARERLSSLVLHRWIRLEADGAALDAYGRHLAYVVTEDGQCINVVMVREGLARVSVRQPLARLEELQRAERDAQTARRGMWTAAPATGRDSSEPGPAVGRSPKIQRRAPGRAPARRKPASSITSERVR